MEMWLRHCAFSKQCCDSSNQFESIDNQDLFLMTWRGEIKITTTARQRNDKIFCFPWKFDSPLKCAGKKSFFASVSWRMRVHQGNFWKYLQKITWSKKKLNFKLKWSRETEPTKINSFLGKSCDLFLFYCSRSFLNIYIKSILDYFIQVYTFFRILHIF